MNIVKNKIKFSIVFLMVFIFLISFTSSSSIPTVQQGEAIELIQYCPTCTFVNISSVTFPDNTQQYINKEMTKNGSTFNHSFLNTSQIGEYIYFTEGDKGGNLVGEALIFLVTPTGQELDTQQSLVILGLIILLLFLVGAFLFFGNKIEYLPFKIFLNSLGILFLMLTIGISVNAVKELLLVGSVFAGTFVNLYRLMLILVSAGGIGLMLYIVYMSIRQFYAYRGLIEDSY